MIGALLIALHGVLFIGIELYRFATASLQNAGDVIFSVIIAVILFLVSFHVLKSTTRKKLVAALILGSPLAVLSIWGVWEGINSCLTENPLNSPKPPRPAGVSGSSGLIPW